MNSYAFGELNRLEKAFNFEQNLGALYTYNGLGNCVGRTEGISIEPVLPTAGIKDMRLNPTKQIDDVLDLTPRYHNFLQRNEDGNATSFIFDFGVLSSNNEQGNHNYLLDDLGSPVRLVDGIGSELDVFGFDEFGSLTHNTQNISQPFTNLTISLVIIMRKLGSTSQKLVDSQRRIHIGIRLI